MTIKVLSQKHGEQEFLIDEEDYKRLIEYKFYAWTTQRHYGLYINCYSPDDKMNPKRLHRIIMNAKKGEIVDHINGNPLDNRKQNLRIVTSLINNQNARKRKDGVTSRFKGVSWCKINKKWKAQIQISGKKIALGSYDQELLAAEAYNNAIDRYDVKSPKNKIANNIADLK